MPTYVYKFVDTGETIEVQQAFTDDALTEATHPDDGRWSMPVKKVFTPVGVTFKGGGFYKTDNRSGRLKRSSAARATTSSVRAVAVQSTHRRRRHRRPSTRRRPVRRPARRSSTSTSVECRPAAFGATGVPAPRRSGGPMT